MTSFRQIQEEQERPKEVEAEEQSEQHYHRLPPQDFASNQGLAFMPMLQPVPNTTTFWHLFPVFPAPYSRFFFNIGYILVE